MTTISKRTYYPPTTPQQRKLLFETWEKTNNVTQACRVAHVGRSTFYYWKPRFDKDGYAGLESYEKLGVPVGTGRVATEIKNKVLELNEAHPNWGKRRLADEMSKANNWIPLISPNAVRRILQEANLWKPEEKQGKKKTFAPVVRTAEQPGQTLNIDLLFVPANHVADIKLPAVSGSSGHLVIERPLEDQQEPNYPGRVFADSDLSYAEAMHRFVKDSAPISGPRKSKPSEKSSKREKIRLLRLEQADLRAKRRCLRQKRQAEDAAWRKQRAEIREQPSAPNQAKQQTQQDSRKIQAEKRQIVREQRRQQLDLRKQEDQQAYLDRQNLRERMNLLPLVSAWIAILLVTDNCSRQCLGLPLFVAGSHVTAEMVVAALRALLPANLQFLISDRGVHFTAQIFQQLAANENFLHVFIARHRPQSNGIAERFVRTLKEWLADKTWTTDEELLILLDAFLLEYNDRPHQGLPTPGLSPNEYARRIQQTASPSCLSFT